MKSRYEVIYKAKIKGLSLRYLLKEAKVSKSGYYYWLEHRNDRVERDRFAYGLVEKIFLSRNRKVGIRQISMIARKKYGMILNPKKVCRIKREYRLNTEVRRRRPYFWTKEMAEARICPNELNMEFKTIKPDSKYSTDISYLPYRNGCAFLSATKDLATREIVAFNVSGNLGIDTGIKSLREHLDKMPKKKREKLMIHSDQGFHYTHPLYVETLRGYGVKQSMSRKGNCLDNAPIESFFGHLKDEMEIKHSKTLEEVREEVAKFIEYYNKDRPQWTLKKMTPKEYRCHLLSKIKISYHSFFYCPNFGVQFIFPRFFLNAFYFIGIEIENSAPSLGSLFSEASPPCSHATCFTIASPSPVPPSSLLLFLSTL